MLALTLLALSSVRSGVLGQLGLLPEKPAALLQRLAGIRVAPYSQRKEAVLRYRVAQQRSLVQRAAREIEALEARNADLNERQTCEEEQEANRARIATLRRDAGVAEGRVLLLKQRSATIRGKRKGFLGAVARAAETLNAAEEASAAVLFSQLRQQQDPWALIRDDFGSIARLGSNVTLAAGYLQLRGASRLGPHAAAIVARAAKLERYAPGILLAVDGYLDLIECVAPPPRSARPRACIGVKPPSGNPSFVVGRSQATPGYDLGASGRNRAALAVDPRAPRHARATLRHAPGPL